MTDMITVSRKEIEALQRWQDDKEIANNCYEDDDGYFILYDDLRALLDKAEVSEPVAKIVYDRKADENGFIYHKSRPQIWSLIRDEKLLNYEHGTKLYTSPPDLEDKLLEANEREAYESSLASSRLIQIAELKEQLKDRETDLAFEYNRAEQNECEVNRLKAIIEDMKVIDNVFWKGK